MSFWSGETLAKRLPSIIKSPLFSVDSIDCNSYQLHLGAEAYISPSREDLAAESKVALEPRGGIGIPPGQFAFLLTEEYVAIPRDAMAFISMRSTYKLKGLVNVSGFHVDPGYRGRLVFAVFNASAGHLQLHRGDACFLIWFANLDQESAFPFVKTTEGFLDIPSSIINPVGGGKLESLAGLSAKINELESRLSTYTAVALLVGGVVMTATFAQCREGARQPPAPVTIVVPSDRATPVNVSPTPPAVTAPPSTPREPGGPSSPPPKKPSD